MLNFDEERFISIQSGALGLARGLDLTLGELLDNGARNLFFLGAGGAGFLMMPAAQYLQRHSTFPTFLELPAEIVETDSVHLGPGSIVVIPSLSGTTKESIRALEFAQGKGAAVITLTGHADTPLAKLADYNFTTFAADDTSSESFYLQSLLIALSIMRRRGEFDDYEGVVSELETLPSLLV
ncbi:MAG: sugar isomerase, partial [Cryobacterium sp.]|nr:sugar isomerase [Cryobacterium sp.]